jgi:Uncharacterized protein, possibly involved in utilization of glycolate and propanediol
MEVTRPTRKLTAMAAFEAVRIAITRAEELGVAVNASVVDAGGREIAFLRGDGAFLPSGQIARDKAYTAAGFGIPTGDLYKALSGEPDVLTGITGQPNVAAFPGGVPIRVGEDLIGGIGVSGASAEQDDMCAKAGLSAIGLWQD